MELRVGVKILLKNNDDKYLILKRSAEKYPDASSDLWDIAGGRINAGDTLMDNLRREVKEETGLLIIGEPELIFAQDILRVKDKHVVRITYIGSAEGEVVLSDEHNEYKWVTLDELKDMESMDRYFKEVINKKLL